MYQQDQSRYSREQWRGCGAWKDAAQHGGFHGRFGRHARSGNAKSAPVNIREAADYYELYLFAPGLTKDAFSLQVSDDVLTIRVLAGDDEAAGRTGWIHREYGRGGFERQFLLNSKIDTTGITAHYVDGVLELMLPKLPGTAAQDIPIA